MHERGDTDTADSLSSESRHSSIDDGCSAISDGQDDGGSRRLRDDDREENSEHGVAL